MDPFDNGYLPSHTHPHFYYNYYSPINFAEMGYNYCQPVFFANPQSANSNSNPTANK